MNYRETTTKLSALKIKNQIKKAYPEATFTKGGDSYYYSSNHFAIDGNWFHVFSVDHRATGRGVQLVVRSATSEKDYTGGRNNMCAIETLNQWIGSIINREYKGELAV